MEKYNIYAGLGGSFGGASFITTEECKDETAAFKYAYDCAVEIYESYVGYHGLRTVEDIMEEDEVDESEAIEIYQEEMEDWLEYYAILTSEDKQIVE